MSELAPPAMDWTRFRAVATDCGWSDAELMRFYADGIRKQLDELDTALAASDAGEVRRLAHGARGASDTCGVRGMSELFRQLEERADQEPTAGAHELVERCRRRIEAITSSLGDGASGAGQVS